MDSQDASNLVAVHLVEALVECKAGATDLDIADFILTRWGVPPEDDQERTEALGAIRDAVVLRRIVVTRQLRL
jgi:hypothetical protein